VLSRAVLCVTVLGWAVQSAADGFTSAYLTSYINGTIVAEA
jgi:hypothetical protein